MYRCTLMFFTVKLTLSFLHTACYTVTCPCSLHLSQTLAVTTYCFVFILHESQTIYYLWKGVNPFHYNFRVFENASNQPGHPCRSSGNAQDPAEVLQGQDPHFAFHMLTLLCDYACGFQNATMQHKSFCAKYAFVIIQNFTAAFPNLVGSESQTTTWTF